MRRILIGCFALLAGMLPMGARPAAAGEAATVEATVTSKELKPGAAVEVAVKLAPGQGVHLYRDKVKVELVAPPAGLSLGKLELPAGKKARDELSGGEVEYYYDPVSFTVPVLVPADFKGDRAAFTLKVSFQGCTDQFCLPPASQELKLESPATASARAVTPERREPPEEESARSPPTPASSPSAERGQEPSSEPVAASAAPATGEQENWSTRALRGGGLLGIIGAFVLGLLVSFTPCVYPMIPVTVALIGGAAAGGAKDAPRSKSLVLGYTCVYVMGIALTYSVLGVVAALTGQAIGSLMNSTPALLVAGAVMVALALSMFGAFDLALPGGLVSKLGIGRTGAAIVGLPVLFVSGAVLGLVASPCVSAPLFALLTVIGERRSVIMGGVSLFAFAWGMSALLILAGLFPGFLARPGEWMNRVKLAFGIVLAAMALYFVRELLPAGLFGTVGILAAVALGIVLLTAARRLAEGGRLRGLVGGLGAVALVAAAYLGLGLAVRTGAWTRAAEGVLPAGLAVHQVSGPEHGGEIGWRPYSEEALEGARSSGRPVVIDFFATWCTYCKELDRTLFSDGQVAAGLREFELLRVDGSKPNPVAEEAVRRFRGNYPTVIVFDREGREVARFLGDARPAPFLEKLRAAR